MSLGVTSAESWCLPSGQLSDSISTSAVSMVPWGFRKEAGGLRVFLPHPSLFL